MKNQDKKPKERHNTAAWTEVARIKPVSKVTVPTDEGVRDAKKWVDTNEK